MIKPNIKKFLNDNAFENGFYESGLYLILKDADNYIDHLESKESSLLSGIISESDPKAFECNNGQLGFSICHEQCKPCKEKLSAVCLKCETLEKDGLGSCDEHYMGQD